VDWSVGAALIGLLSMFAMIRVFHVHQHGTIDEHDDDHGHDCGHDHHHHDTGPTVVSLDNPYATPVAVKADQHHHQHAHGGAGVAYGWVGLSIGLAIHTMIDGMALGASVASEALLHDTTTFSLLGLGTFLAVLLHKPLDAMSITTVMHAGKWSDRAIHWINFAFALMCPLGAALFYFGAGQLGDQQALVVGTALAFAGGVFLCISLADILPEVSFHSHDRLTLTAALLIGVLLAYGIGFLEPAHNHGDHSHDDHSAHDHGHDHHSHAGHDH
ncbi:MAG TPA: ZIP family metal transporter, partial [Pirellulaceae bacterium]|nr:ZIP family metal transporter [Pirellulaceae bacterium]